MSYLTIAIPAYERPELLSECLKTAIESARGYDVSILVCDDSPHNLNKAVVDALDFEKLLINYISNSECLGIDANIKKCFDMASSQYVWVIGEDDHVSPTAVENFFANIEYSKPDIFFLNYIYCTNDYKKDLGEKLLSFENGINRKMILTEFYKFGFIGSVAISKHKWAQYTSDAPIGTYFHHLSVIGRILFSEEQCDAVFLKDTFSRNRAENSDSASWIEHSLAVHFGYYCAVTYFREDLSPQEWELLIRSSKALFRPTDPFWLLSKRADGVFDFEAWLKHFSRAPFFKRTLLLLISYFPINLAKIMKKTYFMFKRD
jgi:glycosyltransferase involved in cell wall biosynthesis